MNRIIEAIDAELARLREARALLAGETDARAREAEEERGDQGRCRGRRKPVGEGEGWEVTKLGHLEEQDRESLVFRKLSKVD
jgi:hypothetical protein